MTDREIAIALVMGMRPEIARLVGTLAREGHQAFGMVDEPKAAPERFKSVHPSISYPVNADAIRTAINEVGL